VDKAVTNASELREAQINRNFSRKDKIATLRWIMDSPLGRDFIWWRLSEAKIFSSTIGPHHEMCHREGKKSMGLQLLELIQSDKVCREKFNNMQDENAR
jgi:hypothetical protein